MFFELWDVRSGSIINTYDTEDEALRVVRDLLTLNGLEYGSVLSLSFEDDDENMTLIANGPALAQRALSDLLAEGDEDQERLAASSDVIWPGPSYWDSTSTTSPSTS